MPLLFVQLAFPWHPPLLVSQGLTSSALIGTDMFTLMLDRFPFNTAVETWVVTVFTVELLTVVDVSNTMPVLAIVLPGVKLCTWTPL